MPDLDPALIVNDTPIASLLRFFNPSWGWCQNCGASWRLTEHHTTWYSGGRGIFALCVRCWDTLGAEAKLHCYSLLVTQWEESDEWPAVASALAAELGHTGGAR